MSSHKIGDKKHGLRPILAHLSKIDRKNPLSCAAKRRKIASGLAFSSAPTAAIGAIEDVQADAADLFHGLCPFRTNIDGMVVRGGANLREPDLAGGDRHREFAGDSPVILRVHPVLDVVAGKGELAS